MGGDSDQALVKRVLQGENEAFGLLVVKYQCLVVNTCYKILRDRDDAEDVGQEVFLEAFQSISTLRQTEDISFWLHRVAFNKSINWRAKSKKLNFSPDIHFSQQQTGKEQISSDNPEKTLINEEARQILDAALDALPERQRKVYILHKMEGCSYQTICDMLELSLSTVESLMFRAKKNLRVNLKNYYRKNYQ